MKLNQSRLTIVSVIAAVGCCVPALQMSAQQGAAAPAAAAPSISITQVATRFENNLMAMAQAMPADKYNFAPSKDLFKAGSPAEFATVRTFAQQITHMAAEPFRFFPAFGIAPDPSVDWKSFDSLTSKDDIIKALKESFDYANKVIAGMTPENSFTPTGRRGSTLTSEVIAMLEDDGDHYGQMVEYMRMNGIVPPSTANQQANRSRPATTQK